jgi:hypothetical protein
MIAFDAKVIDGATPSIRALMASLTPRRLNAAVGPAATKLTQNKLLSNPPNKRGWPTTNFWPRAAKATNWAETPAGPVISINMIGMRQRFHGGEIKPVNAKALTIPVAAEAYGKTAADFAGQLKLVVIPGKGAWLAKQSFEERPGGRLKAGRRQVQGPGTSTARQRLKFLFYLSKGVTQEAHPEIIPTTDEYGDAAIKAIKEAVET